MEQHNQILQRTSMTVHPKLATPEPFTPSIRR